MTLPVHSCTFEIISRKAIFLEYTKMVDVTRIIRNCATCECQSFSKYFVFFPFQSVFEKFLTLMNGVLCLLAMTSILEMVLCKLLMCLFYFVKYVDFTYFHILRPEFYNHTVPSWSCQGQNLLCLAVLTQTKLFCAWNAASSLWFISIYGWKVEWQSSSYKY